MENLSSALFEFEDMGVEVIGIKVERKLFAILHKEGLGFAHVEANLTEEGDCELKITSSSEYFVNVIKQRIGTLLTTILTTGIIPVNRESFN